MIRGWLASPAVADFPRSGQLRRAIGPAARPRRRQAMNPLLRCASSLLIASAGLLISAAASAQIRIGVVLSLTGPGAAIGGQGQNSVQLWPSEMAGQKLVVTIVNDATDPSTAARSASRLINDDK